MYGMLFRMGGKPMNFTQFIEDNNNLIWSIVNNTQRKYFSNTFHKHLLTYYDKDDVYQELLTKINETYDTYDLDKGIKCTTYFTNVCINHLYTLMQPYKSKKKQGKDIKTIDLTRFVDKVDYKQLYIDKMTLNEIRGKIEVHKNKDILNALLENNNQSDVAREFNVTRQRISQIYLEFVKEMMEEYNV